MPGLCTGFIRIQYIIYLLWKNKNHLLCKYQYDKHICQHLVMINDERLICHTIGKERIQWGVWSPFQIWWDATQTGSQSSKEMNEKQKHSKKTTGLLADEFKAALKAHFKFAWVNNRQGALEMTCLCPKIASDPSCCQRKQKLKAFGLRLPLCSSALSLESLYSLQTDPPAFFVYHVLDIHIIKCVMWLTGMRRCPSSAVHRCSAMPVSKWRWQERSPQSSHFPPSHPCLFSLCTDQWKSHPH